VEVSHKLDDILPRCDVINMLRIQFERQRHGLFPSISEYARLFGVGGERLAKAKPGVLLLAPGPINRGVEVTPEMASIWLASSALLRNRLSLANAIHRLPMSVRISRLVGSLVVASARAQSAAFSHGST
jgi:hypothetical protein